MIDSFRALSSPPSFPLSLWLNYGDIFYLSSPPPPSFSPFSAIFLHISVAFPCACLFIHPLEKEAVNLAPAPPHPLTHRTSLHLSLHSSISLSYLSLLLFFSSLSPSHSFLPVWDFLEKCICTRSFILQSLPLFILVLISPLLHSFFDLSFPLKQNNGKK